MSLLAGDNLELLKYQIQLLKCNFHSWNFHEKHGINLPEIPFSIPYPTTGDHKIISVPISECSVNSLLTIPIIKVIKFYFLKCDYVNVYQDNAI